MNRRLLLCLLLTAALSALAQSPTPSSAITADAPLGRLFFSAERRSTLERQRQLNVRETQTLEGETLSINGAVLRSSGKKTYWVNGRAHNDDGTPSGVTITSDIKSPGKATISTNGEPATELQVGESINRATRERQTGLGDGSVTISSGRANR